MTPPVESILRGKRVLVTGSAGFIGSHLCEALVDLGCDVVGLDDLSAGRRRNLVPFATSPNFRLVEADICDVQSVRRAFERGLDIIFHNAASKKTVCLRDPPRDLAVNAGGTLRLLQLASELGVGKFVHASTGSVYGEPRVFPTDEQHPLDPVSCYGVSKLAAERYVQVFHQLYGLNTTILRYFHVYGPRQESNEFGGVVSIFLRNIVTGTNLKIFGDGSQVRSFTWVKDIVRANLLAAVCPRSNGEAYNCASGIQVTIRELAEGLVSLAGPEKSVSVDYEPWVPGDIKRFIVSNRKIREHFGIEFEQDFWGMLKKSWDEFLKYIPRDPQTI
ncbi:MAG: NAD-dependent epimerase/dehydratase family protein [candidate division NC10 bacterium]|nr:NAD-dependent epimerase/dehydratase family protein [candidate division NC10 bacterium]